jgi:hypothetical protein
VKEYRTWLREVLQDWKGGKVSIQKTKDIQAVEMAINHRLKTSMPKVELKVTVAEVGIPKPEVGVDITDRLQAGWGWVLSQLPTKRYRKLLTRASLADIEYKCIGDRMKRIWEAA